MGQDLVGKPVSFLQAGTDSMYNSRLDSSPPLHTSSGVIDSCCKTLELRSPPPPPFYPLSAWHEEREGGVEKKSSWLFFAAAAMTEHWGGVLFSTLFSPLPLSTGFITRIHTHTHTHT